MARGEPLPLRVWSIFVAQKRYRDDTAVKVATSAMGAGLKPIGDDGFQNRTVLGLKKTCSLVHT